MPRELRSHRVSVSLTQDEHRALEEIADKSDLSLSRVVQEAVREFVRLHASEKIDIVKGPRKSLPA